MPILYRTARKCDRPAEGPAQGRRGKLAVKETAEAGTIVTAQQRRRTFCGPIRSPHGSGSYTVLRRAIAFRRHFLKPKNSIRYNRAAQGGVPKWLRERSAKPSFTGSSPVAASNSPLEVFWAESTVSPGFPTRFLATNMYEMEQELISLLSQPRLLLQGTIRKRQHHPPFLLHHDTGQTAALPLQSVRQNLLFHPRNTLLSAAQIQVFVR